MFLEGHSLHIYLHINTHVYVEFYVIRCSWKFAHQRQRLKLTFISLSHVFSVAHTTFIAMLKIFFFLFTAAPAAYGGSQARGRIGASAAGLPHSHGNAGSEAYL